MESTVLLQLAQCCKTCRVAIHRAQVGVGKPTTSKRNEHASDKMIMLNQHFATTRAGLQNLPCCNAQSPGVREMLLCVEK